MGLVVGFVPFLFRWGPPIYTDGLLSLEYKRWRVKRGRVGVVRFLGYTGSGHRGYYH